MAEKNINTAPTESELDDRHGLGEGGASDVEMREDDSAEARRNRYISMPEWLTMPMTICSD